MKFLVKKIKMKFAGFAKNPANRGVVTFLDAYDGKDAELPQHAA